MEESREVPNRELYSEDMLYTNIPQQETTQAYSTWYLFPWLIVLVKTQLWSHPFISQLPSLFRVAVRNIIWANYRQRGSSFKIPHQSRTTSASFHVFFNAWRKVCSDYWIRSVTGETVTWKSGSSTATCSCDMQTAILHNERIAWIVRTTQRGPIFIRGRGVTLGGRLGCSVVSHPIVSWLQHTSPQEFVMQFLKST